MYNNINCLNTSAWPKWESSFYVECFQCFVGHTKEWFIYFFSENTQHKEPNKLKKSHIKSQSQYWSKQSQLDYFPKSFSPTQKWDFRFISEVWWQKCRIKVKSRDFSLSFSSYSWASGCTMAFKGNWLACNNLDLNA